MPEGVASVPHNAGRLSACVSEDRGKFRTPREFRAVRRSHQSVAARERSMSVMDDANATAAAFGDATGRPTCVAYFSMEVALENHIPTYSGGLGVLAGDMLRTAADQALPLVGVSLVHHHGYLFQRLDATGLQQE